MCRKHFMGGVSFSVDMIPHWNKIEAWKLLLDKHNGRRVKTKFLRRTLKKAHVAYRTYPKEEVKTNLNRCWKAYLQRKKLSKTLRPTWMEKKAAAQELNGKGTKAGILRSMMINEEVHQQHRQIKYTLEKLEGRGVEIVTINQQDGKIRVVQDKQELEQVIAKENESKYMLAHDSPPLKDPLVDVLKPSGLSQATTDIVDGKFSPPNNTDVTSRQWFKQMEKTPMAKSAPIFPEKSHERNTRKGGKKLTLTPVAILWGLITKCTNAQRITTP